MPLTLDTGFTPATIAATPYNLGAPLCGKMTYRSYFRPLHPDGEKWKALIDNRFDSTPVGGVFDTRVAAGDPGGAFRILSASIGRASATEPAETDAGNTQNETPLLFEGRKSVDVNPGDVFWSDITRFPLNGAPYFTVTWTLEAEHDCIVPATAQEQYSCYCKTRLSRFERCSGYAITPRAVAVEKRVGKLVGFLGDSITQGFSATCDSYSFWCARLADKLGDSLGFWNLGCGWGRAGYVAQSGGWLEKVMLCDIAVVCFGVNEILAGFTADRFLSDMEALLAKLENTPKVERVILCLVPPFNFSETQGLVWSSINKAMRKRGKGKVSVFPLPDILGQEPPFKHLTKPCYNSGDGHLSDAAGDAIADRLYEFLHLITDYSP